MLSASIVLALGSPALVFAEEPTNNELKEIERISITGSRIKGIEISSTSPVVVLTGAEFKSVGSTNVEDLLNRLPQVTAGGTGTSNNPSDGTATVDLRHLGANRTLVLVNGKRYLQSTQQGTVDLNNIPSALIERVEVVTGGASAVYGSDAIAGVVNFKMKDDFEGLEFNAQYGLAAEGDAGKGDFSTTLGGNFADGRGNVVVHMGFTKRNKNYMADRDFSYHVLRDLDVLPGTQNGDFGYSTPCDGASNCVQGLDQWGGSSSTPATRINGVDGIGTFDQNGAPLPWNEASGRYNWSLDQYLQTPQERRLLYVSGHYDLNDEHSFYVQATSSSNSVRTQLPPHSGTPGNALVDIDSPFLSSESQAIFAAMDVAETGSGVNDGYAIVPGINRRMVETGNRESNFTRTGNLFLVGIEGELSDNWSYNAYYSNAQVDERREANNLFMDSDFLSGIKTSFNGQGELQCDDASARALGCVPINIFGAGNVSTEAADWLRVDTGTTTTIKEQVASLVIDGYVGDAGMAFGIEWREDSSEYRAGLFESGDISGIGAGKSTTGSFDVLEVFGELSMELVESLDFHAGLRLSNYSTAGSVSSYAAGLVWSPTDTISIRGEYQRAVRAPNILELFQGSSTASVIASDPCSADHVDNFGGIAAMQSVCEATGVPTGQTGQYNQLNTEIRGVSGGNPELQEETSDTYTFGIILTPDFTPNLSITADYYSIKIDDAIDKFGGGVSSILSRCYTEKDAASPFCQTIKRRPDGNVLEVQTTRANLASLKTSGIDIKILKGFELDFALFGNDASEVNIMFTGSYLLKDEKQVDSAAPFVNCVGNFGGICGNPNPEWRSNASVTYKEGDLSAAVTWQYMGEVQDRRIDHDDRDPSTLGSPRSKAMNYINLTGSYELSEQLTINGGVNNLFNALPTFLGSNQIEANTYPNVYDVIGTRFFVGATLRF
ncbi:MAG: TonB-dependent receptor [Colwellia sp.]|nr:TonB-dependent receptor [Colwellia sp.]